MEEAFYNPEVAKDIANSFTVKHVPPVPGFTLLNSMLNQGRVLPENHLP